ncbi:4790_t:CDS:2, partial [Gigaspora margarita]
ICLKSAIEKPQKNEILISKGNMKENGYIEKEKPQKNVTLKEKDPPILTKTVSIIITVK